MEGGNRRQGLRLRPARRLPIEGDAAAGKQLPRLALGFAQRPRARGGRPRSWPATSAGRRSVVGMARQACSSWLGSGRPRRRRTSRLRWPPPRAWPASPWTSAVTSRASTRCASRSSGVFATMAGKIGDLVAAEKGEIARGTSPRPRPAVFSQNWYISYGEVFSASSQTVSDSVLPNLVPSALVTSGCVMPKAGSPATRRMSSMPAVMLPHWSVPPELEPCTRRSLEERGGNRRPAGPDS